MENLSGKVALVTGNSQGIGPYISRTLAREGVTIIGVARSEGGLNRTKEEIETRGGICHSVSFDLMQIDRLSELVEQAQSLAGDIDILVNNAGIEIYNYYQNNGAEELSSILKINLHAPMELTRLLLPTMLDRGGHIINLASLAGKKGVGYNSIYSASKAGMIMWTDGLRQELRGTKVGISVICPGYIDTAGMFAGSHVKAPLLLGTSSPQDVADAVLKAIQHGKAEIIVNKGPIKPLLALGQITPLFGDMVVRWFGVPKLSRKRAEGIQ